MTVWTGAGTEKQGFIHSRLQQIHSGEVFCHLLILYMLYNMAVAMLTTCFAAVCWDCMYEKFSSCLFLHQTMDFNNYTCANSI